MKAAESGDQRARSQNKRLERPLFDKEWDVSKLEAILSTSNNATIEFMRQQNLDVYVAKDVRRSCHPLMALQRVPAGEVHRQWQRVAGRDDKILGLFLPKKRFTLLRRNTIVVASRARRWTLVHEFAHFLFNDRSRVQLRELVERYEKLDSRFYALAEHPQLSRDQSLQAQFEDLIVEYYPVYAEVLRQYALEEVTIEIQLSTFYRDGLLKNVDTAGAKNSLAYASSSLLKAVEGVSAVKKNLDRLLRWQSNSRLEKLSGLIQTHIAELDRAAKILNALGPNRSRNLRSSLQRAQREEIPSCGHSAHIRY